jgi:hypothetical protein
VKARTADRLALVALAALVAFLLRDAVFLGRTFYERDINLQWYPQVEAFVRAVAAGSWPVWNPWVSFGQPMLANPNTQVLYPPTWLNLVMRPATFYTWFFAGHLLFGACGLYVLARRLDLSCSAAVFAAAAFAASGPVLSLGNLWNHLAAAAWLPWVLVAEQRALASLVARDVAIWGASLGIQVLAGSPDVSLMTGLLVLGETLLSLRRDGASHNRRVLTSAALAALLGFSIAAGQILPSLELASRSGRGALAAATRTYWSLHPLSLLQLALPIAWNDLPLTDGLHAALFESREPLLFSYYLGLPCLLLALCGTLGPGRPRRTPLVIAAVLAGAVALGPHTPLFGLALRVIPLLGTLRYPSKALLIVAFASALLAGMGLDAWRDARGRRFGQGAAVLTALAAACAILALRLGAERIGPWLVIRPQGFTFAGLLAPAEARLVHATLATAALAFASLACPETTRLLLAATIAIADLALVHDGLNHTAPAVVLATRPDVVQRIHQEDGRRLYVVDYGSDGAVARQLLGRAVPFALAGGTLPAWAGAVARHSYPVSPMAAAFGINESYTPDLLGIEPVALARMHALLLRSLGGDITTRLLQLGAVSQALALHDLELPALQRQAEVRSLFPEPIRLFSVEGALPRVYAVGGAQVVAEGDALPRLVDPSFDFAHEVLVGSGTARTSDPQFAGNVRVVARLPDRVVLEADLVRDGFVVAVDAYDPGWRATLDGRPAPLLCANLAFQAIATPAGRHQIELSYRPRLLMWGLALSALALAAFAIAAVRVGKTLPAG